MALLTAEEFEKAEQVFGNLLLNASPAEQGKILALHDRLKTIFAA